MTLNTYGALCEKLIENFYVPTSAIRPGAHGWHVADDPAAVVCIPRVGGACGVVGAEKLTVVTLNVLARDAKLRAAMVAVLATHGIKGGPIRTDSAGNDAYIVRWENDYYPPHSDEIEGAFAVGGWVKDISPFGRHESAIIRCDGEWRGGDLISTPRSALPSIEDEEQLKTIVSAVREVIVSHGPATVREEPKNDWSKPSEPSWKPYEPVQPARATNLTAAERAVFQAGARSALSHREKARLDRLAASGADAD